MNTIKNRIILLSITILAMSFTGCSKDDEDTDPRDQFVGTYNYEPFSYSSVHFGHGF
ncbi:hypothetical protein FACS1894160_4210 [Bacteroidia bacterium]|nr:hypothetical protein AGMMS50276_27510 [Synergistales bacterium]GHV09003.1 hypothetical protein FACS1894160_4210 [Bacteroidia bacterium]